MKNYGFIAPEITPEDYTFGALGGEVLNEKGDWREFIPLFEHQRKQFDTQSCVTFGTLSALEMLHERLYGTETNYSDRFTSKLSETTRTGNTPKKVAQTIRKYGTVKEKVWPFVVDTWDEYFKDIPESVMAKGQEWLESFDIGYEYVGGSMTELKEALKYSPVGVGVYAWSKNSQGFYEDGQPNHWCVLIGYDESDRPLVWDSYEERVKTLVKDYDFKFAMRYSLIKKSVKIKGNWLCDLCHRIFK